MQCFVTKPGLVKVEHIHRYQLSAKLGKFPWQLEIHTVIAAIIRPGNQDKQLLIGRDFAENFPALFLQGLFETRLSRESFFNRTSNR